MVLKDRIHKMMRRVREGRLPSSQQIVRETFQKLGYTPDNLESRRILNNFDYYLRSLWKETLVTLEKHERNSYAEGIPDALMQEFPDDVEFAEKVSKEKGFKAGITALLKRWYPHFRISFLSVSQSRKQRGGKDFELQIEGLLDLAGVAYTKQERQNRTDLILPDIDTFEKNKNVAIVVSIKRTLRERWAEVAEELFNLRSPNVFLFTADENVTKRHVQRICGHYNIHLVVWDDLKKEKFSDENLVLGYTDWASRALPVLMDRW